MEEYELEEPVVEVPAITTTKYKVLKTLFDRKTIVSPDTVPGLVRIDLESNVGGELICTYQGQQAMDMMKWMNTANFSTTSMNKRILQKLEQDGKLPAGEIVGAPDTPPATF
jgi:hypothetical protein